jgi:hypothetical protein
MIRGICFGSLISITQLAVVHLLAGFPAARVAAHLADQEHHRRGIVFGAMDGNARAGRARAAGDDANAGGARGFGVAFSHKRGAAFLAIGDEFDFGKIHQPIDDGDITFAGDAENMFDAFVAQALRDRMTTEHRIVSCYDTWDFSLPYSPFCARVSIHFDWNLFQPFNPFVPFKPFKPIRRFQPN